MSTSPSNGTQARRRLTGLLVLAGATIATQVAPSFAGTPGGSGRPAIVSEAAEQFREHLREGDWPGAVEMCTPRLRERAKSFADPRSFLATIVPIERLLSDERPLGGGFSASGSEVRWHYFTRLREGTGDDALPWQWQVVQSSGALSIDFEPVPLTEWKLRALEARLEWYEQYLAHKTSVERAVAGIRSLLSAPERSLRPGEPILVDLRLVNDGDGAVVYEAPRAALNASMLVTGEAGRRVPYTLGPVQTVGGYRDLAAGESVALLEALDLARSHALDRPGRYRVQFSGGGLSVGIPITEAPPLHMTEVTTGRRFPSNVVEIEIIADAPPR